MSDLNKLKELRNALACWQDDYDPTEDKEQFDMFGDAIDAVSRLEAAEKERDDWRDKFDEISNWYADALAELARRDKEAGEPVGEVRLGEYDSEGLRQATIACLHEEADWENFPNGTKLFTRPTPPAVNLAELVPGEMREDQAAYQDCKGGLSTAFMEGANYMRAEMLRRIEAAGGAT